MIDERELIKTLLQWKENSNKFAGLKEDAITLRMGAKLWRQFERMYGKND